MLKKSKMLTDGEILSKIIDQITSIKNKKNIFISAQDELASREIHCVKQLYDAGRTVFQSEEDMILPELLINGFDEEQIFQELELGCNSSVAQRQRQIERLVSSSVKPLSCNLKPGSSDTPQVVFNACDSKQVQKKKNMKSSSKILQNQIDDLLSSTKPISSNIKKSRGEKKNANSAVNKIASKKSKTVEKEEDENASNDINGTSSDEEMLSLSEDEGANQKVVINKNVKAKQKATLFKKKVSFVDETKSLSEHDSSNEEDNVSKNVKSKANTKSLKKKVDSRGKPSGVARGGLNVSEMNAYLDLQDRKEMRKSQNDEEEDDDDDEEEDDDDDTFDENSYKTGPKAKDFFDDGTNDQEDEEGDEDDDQDQEDVEGDDDSDAKDTDEYREDDSMETEDKEESSDNEKVVKKIAGKDAKSSFEKTQEKLKVRMAELEETNLLSNMLVKKPWQLKGEVSASGRPLDSLIDESLGYENAARLLPDNDTDTMKTIDGWMIHQIKDKAWDDVKRKVKPTNSGYDFRKKVVLNQNKSELGLAEEYAQAYEKDVQKQAGKEVEKEDPKHVAVTKLMEKLFNELNAMSHFQYTPKQVVRDIKIITNIPSISVENVAPTFMSDAALLAPEQIQKKTKGQLVGSTERTSTDRKRERRWKKKFQHNKKKIENEKTKLTKAAGGETAEDTKKSKLNKHTKGKGAQKMSSTKFFTQLQDDVTNSVLKRKSTSVINIHKTKKVKL